MPLLTKNNVIIDSNSDYYYLTQSKVNGNTNTTLYAGDTLNLVNITNSSGYVQAFYVTNMLTINENSRAKLRFDVDGYSAMLHAYSSNSGANVIYTDMSVTAQGSMSGLYLPYWDGNGTISRIGTENVTNVPLDFNNSGLSKSISNGKYNLITNSILFKDSFSITLINDLPNSWTFNYYYCVCYHEKI